MDSNNLSADRQAYAQAVTFRRVERIEDSLPARGSNADTRICNPDGDMTVGDF